ncbi:Conserved_hypothetical protein [Hexamita inflata]|uniref:Uncharacterized protein n=1 Tax=Hexamita inflata TaxID=28002 RepID=A0AA86NP99_9EUKA|nr:Conserved hypothetical protein [Hexamita inflata]CAI9938936.1 Conserved hypothetical protein [Hexamita inflata]
MADLPTFDIEEDQMTTAMQQQYMQQIMSGAMAPTNSLLPVSMESQSYKNNQLKQQQGAQAPNQDDLMRKLNAFIPAIQESSIDMGQISMKIQYAKTTQEVETAHSLACVSIRGELEKQYLEQTKVIRQAMFKKLLQLNPEYFFQFFNEFGVISEQEENYALDVVSVNTEYITGDIEYLKDVLLENCEGNILSNHLPGFKLIIEFADKTTLEIIYKFDLSWQLSDVKTIAITGCAAELLGLVTKKRSQSFFSDLIPLTEGEMKVMMFTNKAGVQQQLQKSLELAQSIRVRLTMIM